MTETRSPRPGLPRRADDNGQPVGFRPIDKTPRVPPRGQAPQARPPRPDEPVVLTPPPPELLRTPDASYVREEHTPQQDASGRALDARYERVDLPSRFVFYAWGDLHVRRVEPIEHAKIVRASRKKNMSVMLDAIGSLMSRDVRDLVVPDFFAVCHWQKVNGYPGSTTNVTWTSYGDRVENRLKRTRLRTTHLERSRADYLAWNERGLAMATMRDLETIETLGDTEKTILFEHAQYMHLPPLREHVARLTAAGDRAPGVSARIEELQRRGMRVFAEIDEFVEEFSTFGVDEFAEVTHPSWDASRARAFLRERAGADDLVELARIDAMIARDEVPQPKREEVPLSFDLWTMFPWT